MHIDLQSIQVRALIAASVIWVILTISPTIDASQLCTGEPFGGSLRCSTDASYVLLNLVVRNSPVWLFWTAAWVLKWSLPFKRR